MLKQIASYILFSLMAIVILATGAYSGSSAEPFPSRRSLESLSLGSAITVIFMTVAIIAGLTILMTRAFSG